METIRREVALLICDAIRLRNKGKWYTLAGLQCWGCTKLSKGDPAKRCLSNREGYRGCKLVNKRYAQLSGKVSNTSVT
ncbi:hypothetical protein ACFLUF_01445 [Chloroflexota bacterium]